MRVLPRSSVLSLVCASAALVGLAGASGARAAVTATTPTGSGAASLPQSATSGPAPAPTTAGPPGRHTKGRWLRGVTVTEYWAAPESWFVGRMVSAPGLTTRHRIDWLYSADGISMQGEGIGLDGRLYHLQDAGAGGWVTTDGIATSAAEGWTGGTPYWRAGGYWRNRKHQVTFPLSTGGWSNGRGVRYVSLRQVRFALGPSAPVRPLQTLAVDPAVIPLGSRVYVPTYRGDGHGGWFVASDTGGGISGRHIDVYRLPPATAQDPGRFLQSQRIFVVPAKR